MMFVGVGCTKEVIYPPLFSWKPLLNPVQIFISAGPFWSSDGREYDTLRLERFRKLREAAILGYR